MAIHGMPRSARARLRGGIRRRDGCARALARVRRQGGLPAQHLARLADHGGAHEPHLAEGGGRRSRARRAGAWASASRCSSALTSFWRGPSRSDRRASVWKTFWTSSSCSSLSIRVRTSVAWSSGSSVGTVQTYSCSAEAARCRAPRVPAAACRNRRTAQRITSCGSPFSPVLSPISSRPWSIRYSSRSSWSMPGGIEAEHAHLAEQEADAAVGGEIAAVLGDDVAHAGDGARRIVRCRLDQQRDAVRRIALVEHL